jgi:hypothetical protein
MHLDRHEMTTNQHDRKEERSANSGFAKKRVQWLIEHFTSHQLLWCIDRFVLRNPPPSPSHIYRYRLLQQEQSQITNT